MGLAMSEDIYSVLKCYVYVYVDPRNGQPFYIGKGQGSRALSHLKDTSVSDKVTRIQELVELGVKPRIDILRYGLTEKEAILVEAAAIDLIGKHNLSNQVSGHYSKSYGRVELNELLQVLSAKPVEVKHKAMLITINKLYRSGMSERELYEATRGIWALGPNREKVDYCMSVYQGVVREVYCVKAWHPAGTLAYTTRASDGFLESGRWEFEGDIAADKVRNKYVGRFVGLGGQNPIRYKNI